ncbi:hypothetical protein Tco_1088395 [Tanacetum coccineum]
MVSNKPQEPDADHAGCNDDCRSTSGGIQFLGDKLVSWSSKKQDCTAMSSAKAEYVSLSACCAQVIWMRTQLLDYGFHFNKILIYCDSKVQLPYLAIRYNIQEQSTLTSVIILSKSMLRKSIPCSPKCKIVGLILLDHCLSHAITVTIDVPAMYLQQFWRTVSKVSDTEDTIKFLLDTEQFIYTVDMFQDTLQLPVETLENPFVTPANIYTIEAFMNKVGYQGVVDKVSTFFTKNLAQPWQTMFKVFNRCLTTRTSGHDQTKINIL